MAGDAKDVPVCLHMHHNCQGGFPRPLWFALVMPFPGWPGLQDLLIAMRVQALKALALPCHLSLSWWPEILASVLESQTQQISWPCSVFQDGSPGTACAEHGDVVLTVGLNALTGLFQLK